MVLNDEKKYIDLINQNSDIESVINVGLNLKTSQESIDISQSHSKFYSSIGVHPLYIDSQNLEELYELARHPKVVAIGEIGLDNTNSNLEEQRKYFLKQIIIANELHLPIIIHSNNSNKVVIDIFKRYEHPQYGCVFHCFQPDLEDLKYLESMGYYISFAGRITYKTAKKSIEVARMVPNELFLVETDSPYIAPEPLRGTINETANIKYIMEKLMEIKDVDYQEMEKITTENTKRLFKKML